MCHDSRSFHEPDGPIPSTPQREQTRMIDLTSPGGWQRILVQIDLSVKAGRAAMMRDEPRIQTTIQHRVELGKIAEALDRHHQLKKTHAGSFTWVLGEMPAIITQPSPCFIQILFIVAYTNTVGYYLAV